MALYYDLNNIIKNATVWSKKLIEMKDRYQYGPTEAKELIEYLLAKKKDNLRGHSSLHDLMLVDIENPKKLCVWIGFTDIVTCRNQKEGLTSIDFPKAQLEEFDVILKKIIDRLEEGVEISGWVNGEIIETKVELNVHSILKTIGLGD